MAKSVGEVPDMGLYGEFVDLRDMAVVIALSVPRCRSILDVRLLNKALSQVLCVRTALNFRVSAIVGG